MEKTAQSSATKLLLVIIMIKELLLCRISSGLIAALHTLQLKRNLIQHYTLFMLKCLRNKMSSRVS